MRSLSPTLLAAQKAAPFATTILKVELVKKVGAVSRLDWDDLYDGEEADCFHAVTMPGDGSLLRLRVASPGGLLYFQRVEDPDSESTYSSWTSWEVNSYAVALCSYGAAVLAFRVGTDGHVYRRESSDNGASWGSWIDMDNIGVSPANYRVAACFKDADEAIDLYTNGSIVYRRRWNGVSWEAGEAWSLSLTSISGIAVTYIGDWNVVVTGVDGSSQDGIWTCILGDGYSGAVDTWYGFNDLIVRESTEPYEYTAPSVSFPDVLRIFFVEKFTQTTTQERLYFTHTLPSAVFMSNLWREPVPFDFEAYYGLALTYSGIYAWLTCPSRVFRADFSPDTVNVSDDVIDLEWRSLPHRYKSLLRCTLDNTGGKYNSFAKLGQKILVSPGYVTDLGNEYSLGPAYWITGWQFESPPWFPLRAFWPKGIEGGITIFAEDYWAILKRWRARRAFHWEAGEINVFQLLAFIFARCGLEFSAFSTSSAVVNFYPEFDIREGYNGKWAVKKLLEMVPDQIFMVGDSAYLVNPQADDPNDYTYHSTYGEEQLVYRGHYGTHGWDPNRAQVWGDTFMAERFKFPQIEEVYDRLSRVTKPDYPDITRAGERADAELRKGEILEAASGWCHTTWNVGQDPYDIITITDIPGGVNARKFRVLGVYLYYNALRWHQLMKLLLGAP